MTEAPIPDETPEPPTGAAKLQAAWWWRRLPLTSQLAAIGVLVAFAWFLTARLAADVSQAEARARAERMDRLHLAEVAAVRMLASLSTMAASHRGFIINADESEAMRYEAARRAFDSDATIIAEQLDADLTITRRLQRLRVSVALYDDEVARVNFAVRRRDGYAAFAPGTAGSRRVDRGIDFIDSMRTDHARVLREVRERLTQLEAEIETEAARYEWEGFLIRAAAVAIFMLALTLIMRLLSRSLTQVVRAAEALDAGRYDAARLPNYHKAPNLEMARLGLTFDRLAQSIATRERQLQDDIEKLKELERLKADFVSTVSHELRTPLTSMRGALGLLLGGAGGELSPKGRELLRIALTNTDRLIRLINDILDIEKMDAGHVQIRHDRVALRPLLETTLNGLDGFSRDAGVHLRLEQIPDLELIGDSDRLIQVFTNLVSNAVKFTPRDEAVEVSAQVEGESVRVCVRDHGPGIPKEFASRIFGRFQQAGGAESRRSGGTGLGLSIAKGITELHGGRIGFEAPAEGSGSVFYVVLPLAPAAATSEDERPRVLIVEDDESMRTVMCALVEPYAHAVAVPDALTATRMLGRHPYRLIIVDHGLPGMDGIAFARRLRVDPRFKAIPILLYSATEFTQATLKDAGIRIGDAFVKTRDSEQSLLERIRRELQGG
ncbi:ATP-binding protein [Pseudogemmatithrix spongiicola]|uniref:histidine kinase n=1 Tax=Pseudogemmatithrix spongiicola TaxID=3062599 RepID=A0AA49JYF5_9BACT|nr:ATP-binding protein [Gemmatimonadaceae bacterium 'strain 138']WKW14530.1 ATP-binding protein [Gemmatimonadaceae bacterium 'strain 318']